MKDSFKRNTSLALVGSLFSGKIRLPRGHLSAMEDSRVPEEYSAFPEPEVEAQAIESQPDKPKARIQLMRNLIDDFMSKTRDR